MLKLQQISHCTKKEFCENKPQKREEIHAFNFSPSFNLGNLLNSMYGKLVHTTDGFIYIFVVRTLRCDPLNCT